MTDWNLIIQGNISLLWIKECCKADPNETIGGLIKKHQAKYEGVPFLNIGTLMMASYLLFLYPREQQIIEIAKNIDTSKFEMIVKGSMRNAETENQYICRRMRNSLAHGKFVIDYDSEIIYFKDDNNGVNHFHAKIYYADFGNFINDYMLCAKTAYFHRYS